MDVDSTWAALRREAHELARGEPLLAPVLLHHVLNREGLADAVAWMIGGKLASLEMPAAGLRALCGEVLADFRFGFTREAFAQLSNCVAKRGT